MDVLEMAKMQLIKWVYAKRVQGDHFIKKGYRVTSSLDLERQWKICLEGIGIVGKKEIGKWKRPLLEFHKFDVNGAAIDKSGLLGIDMYYMIKERF